MYYQPDNAWESHRMMALDWLAHRLDRRYRSGYLQALCSHGIITHEEWRELQPQVDRREPLLELRGLPEGWRAAREGGE